MKIRKTHAAWAVKFWVIGTVFVFPFIMHRWEILLWFAFGGVLGLVWKRLPEEPEAPVTPLPYQHLYKDRGVPQRGAPPPPGPPPGA